jgi:acyl-CoA synthetase (AMP-forming)/AMP-acid ligase II
VRGDHVTPGYWQRPQEADAVLCERRLRTGDNGSAHAAVGLPDEQWGEVTYAVIVPVPGANATVDDLRAFCRQHLAGYKIQRSIGFVSALPISSAGKVTDRQLREERRTR